MAGKIALDLKQFKHESSDKDSTTLRHKDGHVLTVAHKALSPEFQEQLHALRSSAKPKHNKKMAEGGRIKAAWGMPDAPPAPINDSQARKQQEERPNDWTVDKETGAKRLKTQKEKMSEAAAQFKAKGGEVKRYAEGTPNEPVGREPSQDEIMAMINANAGNMKPQYVDQPQQAPQQPSIWGAVKDTGRALMTPAGQPVPPAPAPDQSAQAEPQQAPQSQGIAAQPQPQAPANQDPSGLKAYNSQMMGGIDKQKQALQEQYNASVQQGKQRAAADVAYIAENQKIQQEFDAFTAKNQANVDATVNDIKANHINPNHYQESQDSGQRVMSAIAMLTGGFGAGLTGGPNPAMEFLNKQIDRDIKAQEVNQSNKVTLLNAYQQQFRDKASATQMTKATLSSLYAGKLALAADQAATPQAKAALLQGAGELQMKAAELTKQATLGEYLNQAQNAADGNPEKTLAVMQAIDPKRAAEMRQRMVPGIGFATTNEGAKTVRDSQIQANNVKQGVTSLRQIMSKPGRSLDLKSRAEADAIRSTLIGALRTEVVGPGAMSEQERALLLSLIPDVTSIMSLDSNSKVRLDTIEKKMENGYRNTLEANGLKMPANFARNPNEGKVAVNAQGQRIIMKDGKWMPYGQ